MVIGVVEHQGQCSPKGEGSVTTMVKVHVIKVIKGEIITTDDGILTPS